MLVAIRIRPLIKNEREKYEEEIIRTEDKLLVSNYILSELIFSHFRLFSIKMSLM